MNSPPYCNSSSRRDFLTLLRLARISQANGKNALSEKEKRCILETLTTTAHSPLPAFNSILPLIYHKITTTGLRESLPEETTRILHDKTFYLIATELAQRQCLINIINLFQDAGIPIILLKGAAFSGNLYPQNTPRLGVDIDLLVKTVFFEHACTLLTETMSPLLLSEHRVVTHETLFERVFTPNGKKSPIIELHRDLTNPFIFNIDAEQLWQESKIHPAFGSDLVRILSPEDTLLHLAVHAFRDLNFCSHNLLDAHEVWCQWKPDEKRLLKRATQWGAKKVLYCLLVNCRVAMGTPIFNSFLKELRPSGLIDLANRKLLSSSATLYLKEPTFKSRLAQLGSQLTFPDKIFRGIAYQISYALIRMRDLIKTIR